MKKCCFIVAFAILLSVIAPVLPAYAVSEPVNVMRNATCIRTVNVNTDKYSVSSYGGASDPSKMADGRYGVGPTNKDEGFNTRTIDMWCFYDADGNEDLYYGDYLWSVTFQLDREYEIDSLALMTMDLTTCGIGSTSPVQWLQRGFDILVSDTGLAGSWKIAHRAEDLHTETSPGEYTYHAPTEEHPLGYYQYDATFDAVKAKYIQLASTDYTSDENNMKHWINISELEIYASDNTPAVPDNPVDPDDLMPEVPVDPDNVMRNATFVRGINFREDIYVESKYGGVCGPEKVMDGRYGVGPSQVDDGFNTKIIDFSRYDLAGNKTENGGYLWYMIFQLDDEYTVDRFSLITDDLTSCGIGNTNSLQWLQKGFDILVSETGEADSWKTVYSTSLAHTDRDMGDYQYDDSRVDRPLGYYHLDASFDATKARYVCFASTSQTSETTGLGHWINISELEIYTVGSSGSATQEINTLSGASYVGQFNLDESAYSSSILKGVSDPTKMIDSYYGKGVAPHDTSLDTRMLDKTAYYNADGKPMAEGEYLWGVTYRLNREYELNSVTLVMEDLTTCNTGITDTIPWMQMGFDLLVSETGADGSWQVVHQARNLHTATSAGKYNYVPALGGTHLGYYYYTAAFTPVKANYIRFASTNIISFNKSDKVNFAI